MSLSITLVFVWAELFCCWRLICCVVSWVLYFTWITGLVACVLGGLLVALGLGFVAFVC